MKVTFLGTGIMGAPMARHLAEAGHAVTAWNRSIDKARPLAEHGVRVAGDVAAAVVGAEVVVTMLTDAVAVEDVMAEAAPAVPDGALWWQASTVGISGIEALTALEDGALTVLASGPDDALTRLAPLFDAVGSKTMLLGDAGTGTRFKLVMNHWVLTVTDAIAETIAFAEGVDLDPALYLEAIAGGPLDLGYAHLKGPGMIAGDLPVAFPLRHALKDAELILEAAERHELDLALAETVRDRYSQAADEGHADEDMAMVVAAARATSAR
jgi:3-hydroxyisobutyrate dehydrogenase